MAECTHTDQMKNVAPLSAGCADCLALGDAWNQLRMCATCGYVGCCDDSKNKHAEKHFEQTGHPIIQSLEQGEDWHWCFIDQTFVKDAPQQIITPPSRAVVRSYLAIAGLYTLSTSVIWGVNTLFLLGAGLSIFEVFVANAVFTGSMMVFEIPTGVLADTRGRRASFLLSVVIVLLGTLGYIAAASWQGGLLWFCFASMILGLGYTFYSGAVEAWLVDALSDSGYTGKLDHVFAQSAMVSGAAMLIGSIGGGLLGSLDLSFPFWSRALLLAMVYGWAFFAMHDVGFKPHKTTLKQLPSAMLNVARESVEFGWNTRPIRLIVICSLIQQLFFAWGFYAAQPYFLDLLGQNLPWVVGVISALFALSTMAGNAIVEYVTKFCGKRTTLFLWAAGVQALAMVGVGLVTSFWVAVPLFLLGMVSLGVWGPVKQAFMHQIIPSENRASVISFDSLVGSGGSVAGQMGLGRLAQTHSLSAGYIAGGFTLVLVLPVVLALRRLNHKADVIVGDAGKGGPCAGQGLPNVAGVQTITDLDESEALPGHSA